MGYEEIDLAIYSWVWSPRSFSFGSHLPLRLDAQARDGWTSAAYAVESRWVHHARREQAYGRFIEATDTIGCLGWGQSVEEPEDMPDWLLDTQR